MRDLAPKWQVTGAISRRSHPEEDLSACSLQQPKSHLSLTSVGPFTHSSYQLLWGVSRPKSPNHTSTTTWNGPRSTPSPMATTVPLFSPCGTQLKSHSPPSPWPCAPPWRRSQPPSPPQSCAGGRQHRRWAPPLLPARQCPVTWCAGASVHLGFLTGRQTWVQGGQQVSSEACGRHRTSAFAHNECEASCRRCFGMVPREG